MTAAPKSPLTAEWRGILSAHELERLQRATLLLGTLLVGIAGALRPIAVAVGSVLFAGLSVLCVWCGLITVIHHFFFRVAAKDGREAEYREAVVRRSQGSSDAGIPDQGKVRTAALPRFAACWQWLILGAGMAIAVLALPRNSLGSFNGESGPLRAGAVIALAAAGLLYFLISFSVAVQDRLKTGALDPLLHLSRLVFGSLLATAAVAFLFLSSTRDLSRWLGWALLSLPAVLAAETVIRFGARFYQPVALRETPEPADESPPRHPFWPRRGLEKRRPEFRESCGCTSHGFVGARFFTTRRGSRPGRHARVRLVEHVPHRRAHRQQGRAGVARALPGSAAFARAACHAPLAIRARRDHSHGAHPSHLPGFR